MYHYYSHFIKLHLQFQGEEEGIEELEELVCSITQGTWAHRHLCQWPTAYYEIAKSCQR